MIVAAFKQPGVAVPATRKFSSPTDASNGRMTPSAQAADQPFPCHVETVKFHDGVSEAKTRVDKEGNPRKLEWDKKVVVFDIPENKKPDFEDFYVYPNRGGKGNGSLTETKRESEDYYRPGTIFPKLERITLALATALARAHRLSHVIHGESDLPWPIIWRQDGPSVTFACTEHPLQAKEGRYVVPVQIPKGEEAERWEKSRHYPVNLGDVPSSEPDSLSEAEARPPKCQIDDAERLNLLDGLQQTHHDPKVASPAVASLVDEWLMDTACPADLIDKSYTRNLTRHVRDSLNPPTFATANGQTSPSKEVSITIPELKADASPHIMKDSPNVLTIGYRVVEEGYAFRWDAYSLEPVFVLPDGEEIKLVVKNYCPYLVSRGAFPAMPVIAKDGQPKG